VSSFLTAHQHDIGYTNIQCHTIKIAQKLKVFTIGLKTTGVMKSIGCVVIWLLERCWISSPLANHAGYLTLFSKAAVRHERKVLFGVPTSLELLQTEDGNTNNTLV